MKPAIIVVDMLKDNLKESARNPYYGEGKAIIPNLQKLSGRRKEEKVPNRLCLRQFLGRRFHL